MCSLMKNENAIIAITIVMAEIMLGQVNSTASTVGDHHIECTERIHLGDKGSRQALTGDREALE